VFLVPNPRPSLGKRVDAPSVGDGGIRGMVRFMAESKVPMPSECADGIHLI
jgi:hypothetical protein